LEKLKNEEIKTWKMPFEKTISLTELAHFGLVDNLNEQAKSLVLQQKATWETAGKNYEAINLVQNKTFDFGHFNIITQFNPGRIRSSAAKTDAKSISERPCFLCLKNLPAVQKGILFQNKYLILTNPYPIFPVHLTISKIAHTPQEILPYFSDLLELSHNLNDFTVFYNGPKCGASAPDHFHFQAVIKNSLPIENEFNVLENKYSETLFQNERLKIIAFENYLRRFIAIVSDDKMQIEKNFQQIYQNLETRSGEEPMMNILCSFHDGKWRIIIFPREKQRPSHFFKTDEKQITVSPAAVEMGGVLVLPEEEDFKKITKEEIEEIYGEVTINESKFKNLVTRLWDDLK
jgi:ATP adenylyltransferase/5',5'''-P-1,P-4-tetraphosphate phosphorylase II